MQFGLGDSTMVDAILIDWPSGIHQVITNVPACRRVTVKEPVRFTYPPTVRK